MSTSDLTLFIAACMLATGLILVKGSIDNLAKKMVSETITLELK